MRKDAYYFPHDSNAKDDPKCVELIESLGLEGYGSYWVLVETLREQPNYKYPLKLIPALARRYNTTPDKLKAVISHYGLFKIHNDEFFFSESLIQRMEQYENKKELARLAGIKSGEARKIKALQYNEKRTDVEQTLNEKRTDVEQREEIRRDKKKEEDNIVNKKKENIVCEKHTEHYQLILLKSEYENLSKKFGNNKVDEMIETIKTYSKDYLKKYSSFSRLIENWLKRDFEKSSYNKHKKQEFKSGARELIEELEKNTRSVN